MKPTGEEVMTAEVITAPPPTAELSMAPPAAEPVAALPATASELPLVGLLGILALGCALVLRRIGDRTV